MNGISIDLDLQGAEELNADLRTFMAGLTNLSGLHESIAHEGARITRDYLVEIASARHDTADRLGAQPSGFWAQDAESVTFTSDDEAATIIIDHPGIGRAAHDRDITPVEKQWLTIALIAAAYNQRAYRVDGLFFVQPKGKDYALLGQRQGTGKEATVTWWYLLVKGVHQGQDRTLLPSDEAYRIAALRGTRNYVGYLLHRGASAQ